VAQHFRAVEQNLELLWEIYQLTVVILPRGRFGRSRNLLAGRDPIRSTLVESAWVAPAAFPHGSRYLRPSARAQQSASLAGLRSLCANRRTLSRGPRLWAHRCKALWAGQGPPAAPGHRCGAQRLGYDQLA
jgi:hypothetical protein